MRKKLKLKCKIPTRLVTLAHEKFKRDKPKENLYKMYAVIKYHHDMELKRNKKRSKPKFDSLIYAPLSSQYFEQVICTRYYLYKKILIDEGFITPKLKYVWKPGTPIFEDSTTETYSVGKVSKSYKALYNLEETYVEMDLEFEIKYSIAAQKNINFLKSVGIENPSIKFDKYGYRLYHNLTSTYKELADKHNYVYYDIKSSVPTFFKLKMMKEGITEDPFIDLFIGDFYLNFGMLLEFTGTNEEIRNEAKQVFMYVANEKRRMDKRIMIKLQDKLPRFDLMCQRKGIARDLINDESNFINKFIVPSLDIDNIMTIFDGLVIHKESESIADEFFKNLKSDGCPIEFDKGTIPNSKKKEGYYAV
jgi:hypothetical protein